MLLSLKILQPLEVIETNFTTLPLIKTLDVKFVQLLGLIVRVEFGTHPPHCSDHNKWVAIFMNEGGICFLPQSCNFTPPVHACGCVLHRLLIPSPIFIGTFPFITFERLEFRTYYPGSGIYLMRHFERAMVCEKWRTKNI